MKKTEIIYEDGEHKWFAISRDPERPDYIIDTNEYLIVHNDEAIITDPGGMEIFPDVFSAISRVENLDKIVALFASHQDPDIISSLSLWLEFKPELKCYLSRLWGTFVAHFGGTPETFVSIPDDGMEIHLNGLQLQAIPAHYLHSAGNFHLYDPKAKILFSGDVGAALLPHDHQGLYVEDFDSHIHYAEGFHKRWMGSNRSKKRWCDTVREMEIDMICPQHGAIYRGENVKKFIDWFANIEVGI